MIHKYKNRKQIIFLLFLILINIVNGQCVEDKKEFNDNENYIIPKGCAIAILSGAGISITSLLLIGPFLSLIGFGVTGPIMGSFAAWVQSIIGAKISSGSLFALLQSIAMGGITFKTSIIVTGSIATLSYSICKNLGYENNCITH